MAFLRKKALWRVAGEQLTLGVRTLMTARLELAGPAGKDASAVLEKAYELEANGADIVEVNPGPKRLAVALPSPSDEIPVLLPVLRKIGPRLTVPVCVMTPNAETARRAVGLGASIIHDITGLAYDKSLAPAINEIDAALIVGHVRGSPEQWPRLEPLTRLVDYVKTDFRASLLRAHKAGIDRRRIVLDPGLEQGKRGHENFNLLRSLSNLVPPGQGVQVSLAGKRFLYHSVRASSGQRATALTIAATLALEAGAHILTVTRPEALRDAVGLVDGIYRGDERQDSGA